MGLHEFAQLGIVFTPGTSTDGWLRHVERQRNRIVPLDVHLTYDVGLIHCIGYFSEKEDEEADRVNTNVLPLRLNVMVEGILNGAERYI